MPSPRHSLVLLRITKLVPNPIYRGFARYFTSEHGILPLYSQPFPPAAAPRKRLLLFILPFPACDRWGTRFAQRHDLVIAGRAGCCRYMQRNAAVIVHFGQDHLVSAAVIPDGLGFCVGMVTKSKSYRTVWASSFNSTASSSKKSV